MRNISGQTRGYAAAIASALVLSTTSVLIRHLTETYDLPALLLAFWRDVFVVLTLLIVIIATRPYRLHPNGPHLLFLAAFGLVLAGFNAIWTISVSVNGAAVATVLAYSSVAFTVLLGPWLLHEKLDLPKGLAVLLSLGGCVLVSGALAPGMWQSGAGGTLTGLLSGLAYALYTMMGRAVSMRGVNPWTSLLYAFSFATIYLLLFNLLADGHVPGTSARLFWLGKAWMGWAVLIALAAGPTVFGFVLYNISLTHLPAGVVNLIATSEPVWSAAIAYIFLSERLTWVQIGGSVLILSAVLMLQLGSRAHRSTPPAVEGVDTG